MVIIPAHNEEETIQEVVSRAMCHADVSVTDDGSQDKTPELLRELQEECDRNGDPDRLHVITHPVSTHIPLAIQGGLRYGFSKGYDWFVTMDAGLSHDPDELPNLFEYDENIDVVIGSRSDKKKVPLYRKAISRMAASIANYSFSKSYFDLFGPRIEDCTSGYRRYSRKAAECIAGNTLRSKAFDFHLEALALCIRNGLSVAEMPITYVFSNSSFNCRVLVLAMQFGWHLLKTKTGDNSPTPYNNKSIRE